MHALYLSLVDLELAKEPNAKCWSKATLSYTAICRRESFCAPNKPNQVFYLRRIDFFPFLDSPYKQLIKKRIEEGGIVPMHITVALLKAAILEQLRKTKFSTLFLVDGFPRAIDQGEEFEKVVHPADALISLECSFDVLLKRVLCRSKQNGQADSNEDKGCRSDDNIKAAKARFQTYTTTSLPVVSHYEQKGIPTIRIDASQSKESVHTQIAYFLHAHFENK